MAGRLSSFFIVPFIYIHVKYMGLIYSCISYDFFSFLILIFSNLIRLSLISNIFIRLGLLLELETGFIFSKN